MEYEIECIVRRYEEDPFAKPNDYPEREIEVFKDRRWVKAGDLASAYDVFDEMKSQATTNIDKDTFAYCPHETFLDEREADICSVCGVTRAELDADVEEPELTPEDEKRIDEMDAIEEDRERQIDHAIDENIARRHGDVE